LKKLRYRPQFFQPDPIQAPRAALDYAEVDTEHRKTRFMSRQYNKVIKRKRRHAYLKRRRVAKRAAAKAVTK